MKLSCTECGCVVCNCILKPWCSLLKSNFIPNYVNVSPSCARSSFWFDLTCIVCCCRDPIVYGVNLCRDYFCRHVYDTICTCPHCTPIIKRRSQLIQTGSLADYVYCRHAQLSCKIDQLHADYCNSGPLYCTCHNRACRCRSCHSVEDNCEC